MLSLTTDRKWHRGTSAGALAEVKGRNWRVLALAGGDGKWRPAATHWEAKLSAKMRAFPTD